MASDEIENILKRVRATVDPILEAAKMRNRMLEMENRMLEAILESAEAGRRLTT